MCLYAHKHSIHILLYVYANCLNVLVLLSLSFRAFIKTSPKYKKLLHKLLLNPADEINIYYVYQYAYIHMLYVVTHVHAIYTYIHSICLFKHTVARHTRPRLRDFLPLFTNNLLHFPITIKEE